MRTRNSRTLIAAGVAGCTLALFAMLYAIVQSRAQHIPALSDLADTLTYSSIALRAHAPATAPALQTPPPAKQFWRPHELGVKHYTLLGALSLA